MLLPTQLSVAIIIMVLFSVGIPGFRYLIPRIGVGTGFRRKPAKPGSLPT